MSFPLTTLAPQPAADWEALNPLLEQFQEGTESDTGKVKRGPGHWNDLPYYDPAGVLVNAGFDSAQATDKVPVERPATARVSALVIDDAGTEGGYLKVYDTVNETYVINATISATGDIHLGASAAAFATNVKNYLNTNKALFGSPDFASLDTAAWSITWAAGADAERWRFEKNDDHLGFGPPTIIVEGAGTSAVDGEYALDTSALVNGRVAYLAPGSADPETDGVAWDSGGPIWNVYLASTDKYGAEGSELSPDLATGWAPLHGSTPPPPTVQSGTPGSDEAFGSVTTAQVNGLSLLRATATVATNVGTKQALLSAVPVGKMRVVTSLMARNASATLAAIADDCYAGFNAGADDFGGVWDGVALAQLTSPTRVIGPNYTGAVPPVNQVMGAAGDVFGLKFFDTSVTATLDIDVFYYDVDA